MTFRERLRIFYRRRGKRCLDVVIASVLLLLTAPLLAILAMVLGLFMGRPILFKQRRPGLHGKPFVLIKFRTMGNQSDHQGQPLEDGARLSRLGRFLRSTSVDELPELINVLRGDMSLVGPRPLLMEYLPIYSADQGRRHSVLPGITGLAQVSGRNGIPWDQRLRLDVEYVDNYSFAMDARIVLRTIGVVVQARDVSQAGMPTVEKFTGRG